MTSYVVLSLFDHLSQFSQVISTIPDYLLSLYYILEHIVVLINYSFLWLYLLFLFNWLRIIIFFINSNHIRCSHKSFFSLHFLDLLGNILHSFFSFSFFFLVFISSFLFIIITFKLIKRTLSLLLSFIIK